MLIVLWLMAIQGVIGAFDTIYYHEWKARLPARGPLARAELALHAGRDFFYAILFGTLPFLAWQGGWVIALAAVLIAEIILTLWDFVVEIAVRKELGDVYAGERVTHAIMGIIYGGMLAFLIPVMKKWWAEPSGLVVDLPPCPELLRWGLLVMAVGVALSGLRDAYAALGLRYGSWPWKPEYPQP